MPLISIIIRTKDEERWIAACLKKIQEQTIEDVEVILVDNGSSDKTVERARSVMPELVLVEIENYLPGYALNEGVRMSKGEYIVCLSSHCIPKNEDWLERMLENFEDNPELAGVYGRQVPMHFTNSFDKRDLIVTFGLDKRVQRKDPFFHNANSMIPRAIWEKYPFDEETTNIEDRLWAKQVLADDYHIIYEPDAPVYHHHGIYQNRNEQRLRNVIRIIDKDPNDALSEVSNPFNEENLNIAALIPVREEEELSCDLQKKLLMRTIEHARSASMVNRVIVDTNSNRIAEVAKEAGGEVPFTRPDHLASDGTLVIDVLLHALNWYEEQGEFFDFLVTMEITHPFRPENIVQLCIEHALKTGLESVVAGIPEYRPSWWLKDEEYRRVDDYLHKRDKREPIHIGLPAICSVITPSLLRRGKRIGERVGIVEIQDPFAQVEIRTDQDLRSIDKLAKLNPER